MRALRDLWPSLRSSLAALLKWVFPEYAEYRVKAKTRGIGQVEVRARSLLEELGRRKGEVAPGDKGFRKRLLDNLRETIRELDGVEVVAPGDQVLKKRLLRSLRKAIWQLERGEA